MAASCGGGGAASLSLRPRAPECDPLLAVQAPLSGPEGGAVPTLLVRIPVLVGIVSFSLPPNPWCVWFVVLVPGGTDALLSCWTTLPQR